MKGPKIYIGTSGWSYPHWRGVFYPNQLKTGEWLSYYSQDFSTVEINNTFYRLPSEGTFLGWRKKVPQGFLFSVKLSRYITHVKRLKDPIQPFKAFLERAKLLEEALGPILVQLPPGMKRDISRLKEFLNLCNKSYCFVIEFRHLSWYHPQVYELLEDHGVAFCQHDMRGSSSPLVATGSICYIRFHGPSGRYGGRYPREHLLSRAREILSVCDQRPLFIYFNNDEKGYAVLNAKEMEEIMNQLGEISHG